MIHRLSSKTNAYGSERKMLFWLEIMAFSHVLKYYLLYKVLFNYFIFTMDANTIMNPDQTAPKGTV